MKPTLSIIILSYNTRDLLFNCLNSIFNSFESSHAHTLIRSNAQFLEIIVVDNASTDGSAEMIAKNFPQVILIRSFKNKGFAAGNNLGLKVALGKYVMLLNSDTEVGENTLTELVAYLESHPKTGLITPKVVLPNGNIDLACHRGLPTPWNAITYFLKLESIFPKISFFSGYHQTWKNFNTIHTVDAAAATAVIVPKSVIEKVGFLDEQFFFYAEDLDWCKRITEAGFEIIYYPLVTVLHHKSASGKKKQDPVAIDYFYSTMKQFYQKHYATKYPTWLKKLVFLAIDLKQKLHH